MIRRFLDWLAGLRGFQTVDDAEFALPCTHPAVDVALRQQHETANGVVLSVVARCKWCAESLVDRLVISAESDGRIVIENATNDTLCIVVDGEMHYLVPLSAKYPAAHVVRPWDSYPLDDDSRRN